MTYEVRECSTAVESGQVPFDKALESHHWPPRFDSSSSHLTLYRSISQTDKMSRFQNYLGLYDYQDLPTVKAGNNNFFSSLFGFGGGQYTHCVLLSQATNKNFSAWVLHEAKNECSAREAFTAIVDTIGPLLKDGTVMITEVLLDKLITPSPTPPEELATVLLDMIENDPLAYNEWPFLLQAAIGTRKTQGSVDYKNASKWTTLRAKLLAVKALWPQKVDMHAAAENNESKSISAMITRRFVPDCSQLAGTKSDMMQEFDKDVDSVDEESNVTPLYKSVEQGHIYSSLLILLSGANPNFVHPSSKDTCLHVAMRQGSLMMVKLLLTFYADMTAKNANGQTPLDVLEDTEESDDIRLLFADLKKLKKEYDLLPSGPVEKSTNEGQFLLSMDGGGTRCASETQILLAVEKRMKELNPRCKPFLSHFDYIAGTSGGTLLTLLMVYRKCSIRDLRAIIINGSFHVSGKSIYERTKRIQHHYQQILGQTLVMADVTSPKVILTATIAETIPPKLHLVTNYGESRDNKPGPKERKIWEAARISSAAPTFYYSYENFMDGGMMANNPTVDAIVEMNDQSMKNTGQPLKLSCVLSMGSGQNIPVEFTNIDAIGESFSLTGLASKIDGYKNMISLLISQATQAEGQDLLRAKALANMSGGDYYRLSASIGKMIPLDTSDPIEISQILFDAFIYSLRNAKLIDSVARSLLSNPNLY